MRRPVRSAMPGAFCCMFVGLRLSRSHAAGSESFRCKTISSGGKQMASRNRKSVHPNELNQMQWYLGEETVEDWEDGIISRRAMLKRLIVICGGSAAAATVMAACGAPPSAPSAPAASTANTAAPEPTTAPSPAPTDAPTDAPAATATTGVATTSPVATPASATTNAVLRPLTTPQFRQAM